MSIENGDSRPFPFNDLPIDIDNINDPIATLRVVNMIKRATIASKRRVKIHHTDKDVLSLHGSGIFNSLTINTKFPSD